MEVAPPNPVKSKKMILTVILDTNGEPDIDTVEFVDNAGQNKPLPKVGQPHPGGGTIGPERGTLTAAVFAQLKWHHHNPECITLEIGGAQYQICFP